MPTKASPETDWWSPTENNQVEGGSRGTKAEEAEGGEAVAQQIEAIISEQAKLKKLLMEQVQQIAFQKGRIEELEKRRQEEPFEQREEATQSTTPVNESRPTYALVVSCGTMEKKDIASLLRRRVDPLDLGIQEATIRPGREGIVLTTVKRRLS
ncbi:hypothetical protein HPB52_021636 [Rhipicephalus sanguineus]|uniref:Uncharacterized protein n=1 Tax=Rhipicephalus sanguineus TaxID=34632 RepID=A0A9D4Q304_RHISA|nr:hypothetical protein HPB52_021636 [Rhipicephalus sanguineus]